MYRGKIYVAFFYALVFLGLKKKNEFRPYRYPLEISPEIDQWLTETARTAGTSRTDILRRAFALLKIVNEQKKNGIVPGFVPDARQDELEIKVVGIP